MLHRETILKETNDFRITYHHHADDDLTSGRRLIVTFGTLPSEMANRGFGTNFALKNGLSTIYVSSRRGSHYQELSLDQFRDMIAPQVQGRRVTLYGSSLGAYCAIYYAGTIDADVIAAAPRCSAMPELNMRRGQFAEMRHVSMMETPKTSGKVVVFWDPNERPDDILVTKFVQPAYPLATYIEFPFAGHRLLETFATTGLLKPFILPMLKDMTVTRVEGLGPENHIWLCNFARKLLRDGKVEAALHHAKASFAVQPTGDAMFLMARIFSKERMVDCALALRKAISADPALQRITFGPTHRALEATLNTPR